MTLFVVYQEYLHIAVKAIASLVPDLDRMALVLK